MAYQNNSFSILFSMDAGMYIVMGILPFFIAFATHILQNVGARLKIITHYEAPREDSMSEVVLNSFQLQVNASEYWHETPVSTASNLLEVLTEYTTLQGIRSEFNSGFTFFPTGSNFTTRSCPNRLLITSFMFTALFTTILFSSFVKATMMMKQPTERIDTVERLVKKNLRNLIAPDTFLVSAMKVRFEISY